MTVHHPSADAPLHAPDASAPEGKSFLQVLASEDWSPRAWIAFLRDLYFTFDRRTLGFSRILLGFLILMDVIHRGNAWEDMYSDIGVLPTWLDLQSPSMWGTFSIFHAFSTPGELRVLWLIMIANALCLMVGYKTKVAQIAALILQIGMNTRISMIENGGYVVNNLLMLWTCFLPMGDRFSVDAMLESLRRRREHGAADLNDRSTLVPAKKNELHVSLVGFVVVVQIAAIYYFNVIHKRGPAWKDGTAVHYVLYNDRMATPLVGILRDYIPDPIIKFMTRSAMAFEASIPIFVLQPLARAWSRRAVVIMMCTLHLAFGFTFCLGPFAWSCCIFATLLFTSEDWEVAGRYMRRVARARVVAFNPRSGAALFACRILARLDRYELLTFVEDESVRFGLSVRRKDEATHLPRVDAYADVLAALPLGPAIAWIPRLPGVRNVVDAVLGAFARRDLSAFFGLHVPPANAVVEAPAPAEEPTPRIPVWMMLVSTVIIAGAVALAIKLDKQLPGVAIIVGVASAVFAIDALIVLPVATFARVRRTVAVGLRELLIFAMLAAAVNQALVELWCVKERIQVPQPEPLATLAHKFRFLQGWFMFSPNPVMDDGTIVTDAVTIDGRHIDPFMGGKPPNFDLLTAKSLWLTQIWGDYFNRMKDTGATRYRDAMKEYIFRYHLRTGRPEDEIVSGEVWWVHDMNPRWDDTKSYGLDKQKLFDFTKPGHHLAAPPPPPAALPPPALPLKK